MGPHIYFNDKETTYILPKPTNLIIVAKKLVKSIYFIYIYIYTLMYICHYLFIAVGDIFLGSSLFVSPFNLSYTFQFIIRANLPTAFFQ